MDIHPLLGAHGDVLVHPATISALDQVHILYSKHITGTDHGTGGLAMLAGGAVAGGRIAGEWPGLSRNALWEERDVRAVNSYESVFKSLLSHHMGLDQAFVEDQVFPNSAAFQPMSGLFRTG